MPKLQEALASLIDNACSEEATSFTAPQLKEVLKLALTAIRQTKRVISEPSDLSKLWNSSTWQKVHDHLFKSDRFGKSTGLHAMCKQIRDAASPSTSGSKPNGKKSKGDGEKSTTAKRKVEEIEGGGKDEADLAKKVKRKKAKSKA